MCVRCAAVFNARVFRQPIHPGLKLSPASSKPVYTRHEGGGAALSSGGSHRQPKRTPLGDIACAAKAIPRSRSSATASCRRRCHRKPAAGVSRRHGCRRTPSLPTNITIFYTVKTKESTTEATRLEEIENAAGLALNVFRGLTAVVTAGLLHRGPLEALALRPPRVRCVSGDRAFLVFFLYRSNLSSMFPFSRVSSDFKPPLFRPANAKRGTAALRSDPKTTQKLSSVTHPFVALAGRNM